MLRSITTQRTLTLSVLSRRGLSTYAHQPQLLLHRQHNTPNGYTLSFSKDPADQPVGTAYLDSPNDKVHPRNFQPHPGFLPILHSTIKDCIHDDFTYLVESKPYAGEFMPIFDLRNVPNYQRSPDTSDTLGFVMCDDKGEIIPDSYQSNAMYDLVTEDGPLVLSEWIHDKLVHRLHKQ